MAELDTDEAWKELGTVDPYWSVLTQDRFRKEVFTEAAREEFFRSGEQYIDWVFSVIRAHVAENFQPGKALDFGCGVGRLVLPLAARCASVVGIDVSPGMLQEATRTAAARGVRNVQFAGSMESIAAPGSLDFINSCIVLQHIPCLRGLAFIRQLIGLLAEGGVGALQVTYSKASYQDASGLPAVYEHLGGGVRHHASGLYRAVHGKLARLFARPPRAVAAAGPAMQMNAYLLNPILQTLQSAGVREFHAAFSDHGGTLGLVLMFRKDTSAAYAEPCLLEP